MKLDFLTHGGISLERLQTLVLLADRGSIAAAAGRDNLIKQSQFSRQLKELGECMGCRLTELKGGTACLTPYGRRLANLAREHLLALDRFAAEVREEPLTIRVGAGESTINWLLIPNQPTMSNREMIKWHYFNLQADDIRERLLDQRLDFGLIREKPRSSKVRATHIGNLSISLFAPRELLGKTDLTPEEAIATLPLAILDGQSRLRDSIESTCQKRKCPPNVRYECTTSTQIASLISSGKAAGPLPTIAKHAIPVRTIEFPLMRIPGTNATLHIAWNPRTIATSPKLATALEGLTNTLSRALNTQ